MRLNSIDFTRSVAIACMIAAHTSIASNSIHSDLFGDFTGRIAAPLFLIVAGLGYEFFLRSKRAIYETVGRSIILFFLPAAIGAITGWILLWMGVTIISPEYVFSIFKWNIFQGMCLARLNQYQ